MKNNRDIIFLEAYRLFGLVDHQSMINQRFLEWFIGFFEAEGSFSSWFDGKRKRLQIEITQKDPKLMYKIKKQLGFGNVTSFFKKGQTYWRYQTSKKENFIRLFYLFNGNFVTFKKQHQFANFMRHFNKVHKTSFIVSQRQGWISLKNGWLSGFLEGDGGFWAKLVEPKKKEKL
jgi:hypothetical protein